MARRTPDAEDARYPVQAVERALDILHILAESPGLRPLGVTDIAERLKVSKSTAHRLLNTLVEYNFVSKGDPAGKYRLGWGIYQIGHRLPHGTGVHMLAAPLIHEAAKDVGETVNLAVRYGAKLVVIDSVGPAVGLKVETPRGIPHDLHASALGKALLLGLDDGVTRDLLGPGPYATPTEKSISCARDLLADLAASRKRGYTLDDEESGDGVRCVAVPVRDHRGEVVAAVSITGPAQRLTGMRLEDAAARVKRLGLEISRLIGFEGESTV